MLLAFPYQGFYRAVSHEGRAQKSDALIWQKRKAFPWLPPSIQRSKIAKKPNSTAKKWVSFDPAVRTKHYLPAHIKQFLLVGINWCNDLKTRAATICGETLTVAANPTFGSPNNKKAEDCLDCFQQKHIFSCNRE